MYAVRKSPPPQKKKNKTTKSRFLGEQANQFFNPIMYQSIPSTNISPRADKPSGNFVKVVKSYAPGQQFSAKVRPPGQNSTHQ